MTTSIFAGTLSSGTLTAGQFLLLFAAAIALGLIIALVYSRCGDCTKSFAVALALLPGIVCVVILMVSGSIGAGVAVAGTFSLVRFRSAPGTAREILAVFLAMAAGLACGMGCVAVAAVSTVLVCLLYALLSRSHFGEEKNGDRHRTMHITVPESLEYAGAFDDIFDTYTESRRLVHVKTTSLGSLNRLTYDIMLRRAGEEKAFIDALRCRNGNLEISLMQHAAEGCEL